MHQNSYNTLNVKCTVFAGLKPVRFILKINLLAKKVNFVIDKLGQIYSQHALKCHVVRM